MVVKLYDWNNGNMPISCKMSANFGSLCLSADRLLSSLRNKNHENSRVVHIEKGKVEQLLGSPSLVLSNKYMQNQLFNLLRMNTQLFLQFLKLLVVTLGRVLRIFIVTLMSLAHLSLYFSPSNGCRPSSI